MLTNLRIGPKLGLMMLVPLFAVVLMVGIVWQDSAAEMADAREDRRVAEAVSVASIIPRQLLSETLFYDIGVQTPEPPIPAEVVLLQQLRSIVDESADAYRALPEDALPEEFRRALDAELSATLEARAKADAGTLSPEEIADQTRRQRELNAAALAWLGSQDVFDPKGSWRLLVVTAPSNATLLDGARLTYRALVSGRLPASDAQFLQDALASYLSLSQLQDTLLPEDRIESRRTVEDTRTSVTELIGRALALEGQENTAGPTPVDRLDSYRLGATVLLAGTAREQSLAQDVIDAADDRIAGAQRDRLLVLTSMSFVLLLALGAMVLIARDIVTRLGRVSEQAERLNAGVMEGPRSAATGSDEIAVLGTAMNGVSNLYRRLVAQTEAIGAGRLDDRVLREPLPGALGAALQSSVNRVASSSAELLKLATHDDLTDLLDRSGLARAVEALSASRGSGTAAAFFVDLDGFKEINDAFGHAAGDEVLVETAERLKEVARAGDAIARLGGDEFVVLAPQVTDAQGAKLIAERMAEVLNRPLPLEDGVADISASIGWSLAPPGESLSGAIENADREMYRVKRSGDESEDRDAEGSTRPG